MTPGIVGLNIIIHKLVSFSIFIYNLKSVKRSKKLTEVKRRLCIKG